LGSHSCWELGPHADFIHLLLGSENLSEAVYKHSKDMSAISVDLRVIDFDWAGEVGQVRYQNGIETFGGLAKQEDQLSKITIREW